MLGASADPRSLALCPSNPSARSPYSPHALIDILPRTVPVEEALAKRKKALENSETGATDAGDALMSSTGNTGLAPGASAVKKSRKKKVVALATEEGDGAEGSAKEPEAMQVDA